MKKTTRNDYEIKIREAQNYIQKNLDEKIPATELAKEVALSEFHFQRIFRAFTGESIASYMRRLKLERAANSIIGSPIPLTEIALTAGFETSSAFNKAFKKHFGVNPTDFKRGLFSQCATSSTESKEEKMETKIVNIDEIPVISVRKTGPYEKSACAAWEELCQFAFPNQFVETNAMMLSVSYDNPDVTDSEKLRYDACIETTKDGELPSNVFKQTIPGGRYSIFRHTGPYDGLLPLYRKIYAEWLPSSGEELRDHPGFEVYINNPGDTAPENLITDIYLPLK